MKAWELSLGIYPGVLMGIRSYPSEKYSEHVLYLPFVEFCLTIYNE